MQPTHSPVVVSSTQPQRQPQSQFDPTLRHIGDLEQLLHHTLAQCNKIAKSETALTHEVAAAKMLNYCVRMLHADGWHPPTIVRAMVLQESGAGKGMRGTMHQALRERRREIESYHLYRAMVPEGERGSYSSSHSAGTRTGGSLGGNRQGVKVNGKDGISTVGREVDGAGNPSQNTGAGISMKDKHATVTSEDGAENISLI